MIGLIHITTKLRYLLRGRSLGRIKGSVAEGVDKDKKSRASVGNAEHKPSTVMVSDKGSEKRGQRRPVYLSTLLEAFYSTYALFLFSTINS
ncbi:unnamed protein product [Hymenolepis diminuta]|uniref:Transmembrane protein n=1 Tax=Hymenolepis diminuta TaxID=6216 RepID=A0A0R3STF8_HYMDI|nr:unnamed protein product [Hymenolepis diminuta]